MDPREIVDFQLVHIFTVVRTKVMASKLFPYWGHYEKSSHYHFNQRYFIVEGWERYLLVGLAGMKIIYFFWFSPQD